MRLGILAWINEGHFIHHLLPVLDVPVDIEIRDKRKNQKRNTRKIEERPDDERKERGK